jgi:hypothetical protein
MSSQITSTKIEKFLPEWLIITIWSLSFAGILVIPDSVTLFVIEWGGHFETSKIVSIGSRLIISMMCFFTLIYIFYNKEKPILHGFSIPLYLSLLLVVIKYYYCAINGQLMNSSEPIPIAMLHVTFHFFFLLFPMLFFSCGITGLHWKKIVIPIIGLFFIETFFLYLFYGNCLFQRIPLRFVPNSLFFNFMQNRNLIFNEDELEALVGSIRRMAEYGCFSNVLLLWCWLKKVIPFKLFLPLYALVTFPCYASGSVYVLLAIIVSHFMGILLIKSEKNFNFLVSCILIFICNIGFLFFFNQDRGIYTRSRVLVNSIGAEASYYVKKQPQQKISESPKSNHILQHPHQVLSKVNNESRQEVQNIPPTLPNTLQFTKETRIARLTIWKFALCRIYQNPILGDSFYINFAEGKRSYPHNVVVQGYMGLGIIGGSLFLFVFCIGIRDAIICLRNSSEFGWLALLFWVVIIKSLTWNDIITDHMLWFSLASLRTIVLNNQGYVKTE